MKYKIFVAGEFIDCIGVFVSDIIERSPVFLENSPVSEYICAYLNTYIFTTKNRNNSKTVLNNATYAPFALWSISSVLKRLDSNTLIRQNNAPLLISDENYISCTQIN